MPSLTDIDPQGELVRRIRALEAEFRRVSTLRRQPSSGGALAASNFSQTFANGVLTHVALGTVITSTRGMADAANSRIVIPVDGVWQIGAVIPTVDESLGGDAFVSAQVLRTNGTLVGSAGAYYGVGAFTGGAESRSFTSVEVLSAGETLRLFITAATTGGTLIQTGAGPAIPFRLSAHRLSDIPEQP